MKNYPRRPFPDPNIRHPGYLRTDDTISLATPGLPLWEALRSVIKARGYTDWTLDVFDHDHAQIASERFKLLFDLTVHRDRNDCPYFTRVELHVSHPEVARRLDDILCEHFNEIEKIAGMAIGQSHGIDFEDEEALPDYRISSGTRWREVPLPEDEHRVATYLFWQVGVLMWFQLHGMP